MRTKIDDTAKMVVRTEIMSFDSNEWYPYVTNEGKKFAKNRFVCATRAILQTQTRVQPQQTESAQTDLLVCSQLIEQTNPKILAAHASKWKTTMTTASLYGF